MEETNEERLERARELFYHDVYATNQTGCTIESLEDNLVVCKMTIDKTRHANALGAVMGGVYFTLADFSVAIATNFDQDPAVSVDAQIQFMAAPKGDTLFATTRRIKTGKRLIFLETIISDGYQRDICRVHSTLMRI